MVPDQTKVIKLFTPATVAAAATTTGCVDTLGYDYATIDVMAGSIASNATAVTYLQVSESDTAMTAYTDGTAIVALTGAAAVSATAGFVLPAPSTATVVPTGCTYRMNVDLRGRKRYLTLLFTPAQTVAQAAWASLGRVQDGPASPIAVPITNSTEASQCHLNVSA